MFAVATDAHIRHICLLQNWHQRCSTTDHGQRPDGVVGINRRHVTLQKRRRMTWKTTGSSWTEFIGEPKRIEDNAQASDCVGIWVQFDSRLEGSQDNEFWETVLSKSSASGQCSWWPNSICTQLAQPQTWKEQPGYDSQRKEQIFGWIVLLLETALFHNNDKSWQQQLQTSPLLWHLETWQQLVQDGQTKWSVDRFIWWKSFPEWVHGEHFGKLSRESPIPHSFPRSQGIPQTGKVRPSWARKQLWRTVDNGWAWFFNICWRLVFS